MDAMEEAFQGLWKEIQKKGNFWTYGHAMDTALDYLAYRGKAYATSYGPAATDIIKPGHMTGEAWYDDDGWWNVAALKAYVLAPQLGWEKQQQAFLDFCLAKWERFNKYAPEIWTKPFCQSGTAPYSGLAPKYPGGVWNTGWQVPGHTLPPGQEFWGSSRTRPWSESGDRLGGFQNTVTNGLRFVTGQRFYMHKIPAETYTKDQRGFFLYWFSDPHEPLLNRSDSTDHGRNPATGQPRRHPAKGAVVRERVGQYADPSVEVVGYDPDMAWAGDQGILLGACIDFVTNNPDIPPTSIFLTTAKDIIAGVTSYLVDDKGILQHWPMGSSAPGGDDKDYVTGTGAFMRYLLYAYNNNADIKAMFAPGSDYAQFVKINANYEDTNYPSDTDPITPYVNRLARLLAGAVILGTG
ncbi:MAG TPA: hypothetical protein VGG48_15845 [Rhizomicrobium sp.]|jgi:hypothetical protein